MATATKTRKARKPKSDFNIKQVVSEKLIAAMTEKGRPPWKAPYLLRGLPLSMSTGRPYRGLNPWLLTIVAEDRGYTSSWWGTYEQIQKQGGQVTKKPEGFEDDWGTLVVWWSRWTRDAKDDNGQPIIENGERKQKTGAILKYFKVFNAEQAEWPEGLPTKFAPLERGEEFDPIAEADSIVVSYASHGGPVITHVDQNMAWYSPINDQVNVPNPENIRGTHEYYSTLFHELGHSTGHRDRLNRDGITELGKHKRGTVYAFEELVAEFSAAMLCASVGIEDTLENSAAYLKGWVKYLTDDPDAAVNAASRAQAAADLILDTTFDNEESQ
jgi:antirestriction protein ArdC